jgi:hypothetical protein
MAPDDLDRDKLYTADADDSESDDELELEPPDPEVLAAEQRQAAEAINAHRKAIDINEVYNDLDANRDNMIVAEWLARWRGYRFQFQIRHLLILTAVVALLLAVRHWIYLGTLFIVGIMLAVAGISLYLKLEENKRQEEADRRRQKMYAERRAHQAGRSVPPSEAKPSEPEPPPQPAQDRAPPLRVRDFRFQFSLSQLLIAFTVAAVLLGFGAAFAGASSLATICILVVLAGLIVPAMGLRPPDVVVFGWWMLLALYVGLSFLSMFWAVVGGH